MSSELDAYFRRISYDGPRDPCRSTLDGIVAAHVSSIPFENLDVLLGRPIVLELDAVFDKLVHQRRGGYCFEQNGLLLHVLESLGFAVVPISARVRLQRPRDFTPPRTHMFVRVEIGGESWLADVGVGGLSPTSALRLETADEQRTPHEPRRIVVEDGRLFHQVRLDDEAWSDVCEFTLEQMPVIDREVANWYTSMHPQSHFKNRLLVARSGPDGVRHTLLNTQLGLRHGDGRLERREIADPEQLLAVLDEVFDLRFPAGTRFACDALPW